MQLIEKSRLKDGMVLGQDIYFGNQMVLRKGTVLDTRLIDRLRQFNVPRVMIEDEVIATYEANIYQCSSYSQRIQNSPEFKKFQKDYDVEVTEFQSMLNGVVERNQEINVENLYHQVVTLLKDTGNTINAFDMVQNLRHYDDSTYAHSINVGLLSNVFASWLGMDEEQKKLVTVAGILHDIGKTKMPLYLIQKPGKLNSQEYAVIQQHTNMGFQILKENNLNIHICFTALQHHERCDGGGYPGGRKQKEIDEFAKIVSIVDVYDAMTSPRVYRKPMCPFDVINLFEEEGLQKYESAYILTFLQRIAETYLNERVRLNDGREGALVYIDRQALSRPTILIDGTAVDLRKYKDLAIEEIL